MSVAASTRLNNVQFLVLIIPATDCVVDPLLQPGVTAQVLLTTCSLRNREARIDSLAADLLLGCRHSQGGLYGLLG